MRAFASTNYTGFFKIIKKHDKIKKCSPVLMKVMPFVDTQFGMFLRPVEYAADTPVSRSHSTDRNLNTTDSGGHVGIDVSGKLDTSSHSGSSKESRNHAIYVRKSGDNRPSMNIKGLMGWLKKEKEHDKKVMESFDNAKNDLTPQDRKEARAQIDGILRDKELLIEEVVKSRHTSPSPIRERTKQMSLRGKIWHTYQNSGCFGLYMSLTSGYKKGNFLDDLLAALIISFAGIPKAMSYAALLDVPVAEGIPTLYVPCFVYALICSSRQVTMSPQSVPIMLLATIVDEQMDTSLGLEGEEKMNERMSFVLLYTIGLGVVILTMGVLQLGFLVRFISKPVLSGFISASALIAAASTLKAFLGVSIQKSPLLHEVIIRMIEQIEHTKIRTLMISVLSIALMVFLMLARKKKDWFRQIKSVWLRRFMFPAWFVLWIQPMLVLMIVGLITGGIICDWQARHEFAPIPETVLEDVSNITSNITDVFENVTITNGTAERRLNEYVLHASKGEGVCIDVDVVGYIPKSFPEPVWPTPKSEIHWGEFVQSLFVLAVVSLIEHMANVSLFADMHDYDTGATSELVAVGLANICGGVFGSFAVAGGFSRSSLNRSAHSQVSQILSVFISLLIIIFMGDLLSMLPQPIINVFLFIAVMSLVDFATVIKLASFGYHGYWELLALSTAFFLTCFLGVLHGMLVAISMSLAGFIYQSTQARVQELQRTVGTLQYEAIEDEHERRPSNVKVLKFEASLWFANAHRFSDRIREETNFKNGSCGVGLVLHMSGVRSMDVTAAQQLEKVLTNAIAQAVEKEVNFICVFSGCNKQVEDLLTRTLDWEELHFFHNVHSAVTFVEDVLSARPGVNKSGIEIESSDQSEDRSSSKKSGGN